MSRSRKLFQWVILISILLSLAGAPFVETGQANINVHPSLLALAGSHPDETVSVIAQVMGETENIRGLVAQLGGEITQDLSIINAVVIDIPAGKVDQLARHTGIRWISPDAPVIETKCHDCDESGFTASVFVQSIGAEQLWEENPNLSGEGITVAIVDSGIQKSDDLKAYENNDGGHHPNNQRGNRDYRIVGWFSRRFSDGYGHGTHITGIVGGSGENSDGLYRGVAPGVNFVDVKVANDRGEAKTSSVVAGLQWIYNHKDEYNIRVVNFSMNSTVLEDYHNSPLDAALEILWFNEIVVVVSAGNNGSGAENGILYPPANDPFVITVGAVADQGTADISDDELASFSAYGTTLNGFNKPDLVAPGKDVVSILSKWKTYLAKAHPDHIVNRDYFRMSGTSMASAVTSGSVALLLQDEPGLNPDQVKYRLIATAKPFEYGNQAGYLDIYAAVHGETSETANTGYPVSQLLWTGSDPINWGSVNWSSVNWSSVNWSSVNWSSVNWSSVNWSTVYWDE